MSDEEYRRWYAQYCRWYADGFCTLNGEKCQGYDVYDCGEAEDFDDCNPNYD